MLPFLVLLFASERVEIHNGALPAPGPDRCVRLHAAGNFRDATVRVNQINAGQLSTPEAELDITGYLSPGAANTIEVAGTRQLWVWLSPPIYISRAEIKAGQLEITIVNTTENTAHVQIAADHQFTVSPGTSATKKFPWNAAATRVHMRAVTDGLDREFIDVTDASAIVIP